jgi:SAM-dependent methyltransferase
MIDLSNTYWNERYTNNDFGWDIGEVSMPLKNYFLQLNNKDLTILIPGAGNSYEAEFLYLAGFKNVYVLDFAAEPLQNIKQRLPDVPESHLIQQDFFEHNGQYDLIIEQTFFCAINPSLREKYVLQMKKLIKPNGILVGVLFNDVLNSNKPPFGGNENEYRQLFEPVFHIKKMELCYNSIKPRQGRELFVIMENKS